MFKEEIIEVKGIGSRKGLEGRFVKVKSFLVLDHCEKRSVVYVCQDDLQP
jgi:hypothetical protein